MDLVDHSEERFNEVVEQYKKFAAKLNVQDIRFIPISALHGDNVVNGSENMKWYKGGTLLHNLETIHIGSDENLIDCRFPVQTVIRPFSTEYHDYRGYAGTIAGGVFKPGDEVITTPLTFISTISMLVAIGAKPILADIDPGTFNIDPAQIEKKISKK